MSSSAIQWELVDVVAGQDGYFDYPSGICFDRDSHVFYISDLHGHRVCWLKADTWEKGELPREIDWQSEKDKLDRPLGITCSLGDLVVTDAGHNAVFRWNPGKGKWVPIPLVWRPGAQAETELNLPSGVAMDSHNNIYISDFANNRILKVKADGQVDTLVGGADCADKEVIYKGLAIDKPYGLFCNDERLFFVDTGNNLIHWINFREGRVITLPSDENAIAINHPVAITLDPQMNIYVCEQRRILRIEHDTYQVFVLIDKDIWKSLMKRFGLQERICYTGAILAPEQEKVYWVDTIKGLIYRMTR